VLAIVAYEQPITRADISHLRGTELGCLSGGSACGDRRAGARSTGSSGS